MSASPEEMMVLSERLEAEGYEGWLPTTITATAADVKAALARLPSHRSIWGFHLEGPFISPVFPGAQPPEAIIDVPTGASEWDAVLDDDRLKLITLAPERPNATSLIHRLASRGVTVSLGHSNATYAEAMAGHQAGLRHTTHTFNAMRALHHREAGCVGFALLNNDVTCELIYDRLHVSPAAAAVLLKAKPETGVVAVSDCTKAKGLPPGSQVDMWGHAGVVGEGDVRLAGTNTLAGSAITLRDAFANLWADFGPEVAVRTCTINPRLRLGAMQAPRLHLLWSSEGRLQDQWRSAEA
jgi:N-acetylglucosamine-6-phosphate deacetylase